MFDINPADATPIWKQIEDGMRRMIALGTLRPGEPVPSVRDLAKSLRVNPNTVARSYQRLTDHGVFVVRRGEGTYVADEPTKPKQSESDAKLRAAAGVYAGAALAVGATLDEAAAELENNYKRLVQEHRRTV